MKLIDYFRQKKTAPIAKDRLSIIIAQQRSENGQPDYLPILRNEILALVAKYTHADMNAVKIDFQHKDNNSILELNVILPGNSDN